MITNLDPASELFLANVGRIQERLAEANRQVSSGKRVTDPADAPDQIDSILQLRANREQNSQIRSNLAVGLPLDLMVLPNRKGSHALVRRVERDDAYYNDLSARWGDLLNTAAAAIPDPPFMADLD